MPGYQDSKHDIVLAIMDWVEKGKAVDQLVVTKFKNDNVTQGVHRQRPICPYPQNTVYEGKGNVNASDSWSCAPYDS